MTSHHQIPRPTTTTATPTEEEQEEVLAEIKRALGVVDDTVKPVESITISVTDNGYSEDDTRIDANQSDMTSIKQQQQLQQSSSLFSGGIENDCETRPSSARGYIEKEGEGIIQGTTPSKSKFYVTGGKLPARDTTNDDGEELYEDSPDNNSTLVEQDTSDTGHDDDDDDVSSDSDGGDVASEPSWQSQDDDEEEEIHLLQDGADDMTYDELLELVERLYQNLKQADEALTKERSRRTGREKNLIKLAKELKSRKNKIDELEEQVDDLEEDLRVVRSERTVLEERLDRYVDIERNRNLIGMSPREELEESLILSREQYEVSCIVHEERIQQLKEKHKAECEALCREIVQANTENARLQKLLEEQSQVRISPAGRKIGLSINTWELNESMKVSNKHLSSPYREFMNETNEVTARKTIDNKASNRSQHGRRYLICNIFFAILTFSLAIVGHNLYSSIPNGVPLGSIDFDDVSNSNNKKRAKSLRTKSETMIVNRLFSRQETQPEEVRYHIHPMISMKDSVSRTSFVFRKEFVPNPISVRGRREEKVVVPDKSTTDSMGRSKARRSIFHGFHNAIGKIGRLLQKVFKFAATVVRRLIGKESQAK